MTPEESLKVYELFEALRTFEPGQSDSTKLFALIDSSPLQQAAVSRSQSLPTPLHTAVRCAKLGTVDLVLRHLSSGPGNRLVNAKDLEGQTPLHLASSLGRSDVVMLLLSQPGIDDTLRDAHGRTPVEVAKGSDVATVLQVSRAQFLDSYASLLASYVATGPSDGSATPRHGTSTLHPHSSHSPHMGSGANLDPTEAREALFAFVQKERAKCLDFSTLTPGPRGTTIVHEAARRKDVDMLKACAARGASMVVRDRKGKMPLDVAKDESVRALLRQGATSEGRALRTSFSAPGGLTGMAGISSGSPALSSTVPADVRQHPPVMKGYLSKWTNMARGYRTRWFVLREGHISYYRDAEEENQASRGTISMSIATVEHAGTSTNSPNPSGSANDKSTSFVIGTHLGKSPKWFLKGNHPVETLQWVNALRQSMEVMKLAAAGEPVGTSGAVPTTGGTSGLGLTVGRSTSANTSTSSLAQQPLSTRSVSRSSGSGSGPNLEPTPAFPGLNRANTAGAKSINTDAGEAYTRTPSPQLTEGSIYGDDEVDAAHGTKGRPPHHENFELLSNSAKSQVHLTEQLVASLGASDIDPAKRTEVISAARRSLQMLATLFDQHLEHVDAREKWFTRRYEREMEAKRIWEENMRSVVTSQAELEQQLQDSQRLNSKRKRALRDLKQSVLADLANADVAETTPANEMPATPATPPGAASRTRAPSTPGVISPVASTRLAAELNAVDEIVSDSSDDEDFYDAVESGAIPLRVETPLASPNNQQWPEQFEQDPERFLEIQSYEGYRHLRDRLPITADERPPVSLWAILKGSIGKDLTKISFPVYFNEPTSMLQRMAEDMEYSECLDAAAGEQDSLKRLAFVTGFAMSNYASTIGRIAKPFNPMLSETFELANLDKKYRYISEQVSHHPPMSACIAESPRWNYYGEVDAKSKFLGKSFEIRPTGMAHAELFLPKAWAPDYPAARMLPDTVREHYSWKKVTTSVSNFIMGAPQIDHYGDMEVTNHRTGERCVLTFKPRGWRGANACEVKGSLYDAQGTLRWEMAGRWNGQLVARRAGAGKGDLGPDEKVPSSAAEYLLIWKINQQSPNMPFNLTRFALTLNDARDEIKRYLPPTDCRLRPDQHAFEDGKFEKANELKTALEAFQRNTRAKRERGEVGAHEPRWFTRSVDKDSDTPVWEPKRQGDGSLEYWKERNEQYKAVQAGEERHWNGVEQIFGITI